MRKRPILRAIWILITVLVIFGLVQFAGHLLDPFEAEDGLDAVRAFHKLEDNSVDVIILGSSRAWKGCDTRIMRDEYGIRAYNYACNWQALNTTLLFMQDSLRSQSPKVIFVETGHVNKVLKDTDLNGEIYYTRYMPSFKGKKDYLKQCFGKNVERYVSYCFPLIMFHDNWTQIDFENFYAPGPERYIRSYGYSEDSNTEIEVGVIPKVSDIKQKELSRDSVDVLNKMVDECEINGVKIVFYTAPCYEGYKYSDAMKEYTRNKGIEYLNLYEYMDEMKISGETDFQDGVHLNKSGAEKVARFLSSYAAN